MPLRKFRSPVVLAPPDEPPNDSFSEPERQSFWRSGLLIATSAALGGIAVAIWNRRTLAQMRQQTPSRDE
jgi:hypothetical protein